MCRFEPCSVLLGIVERDLMCEQNRRAEYASIREENLQLNSQAFQLIGGSLTLDFVILGYGLSKAEPGQLDPLLPFTGIITLFVANLLIAHKIRMAHRLAIFLKFFVVPKLPGILWPKVYFEFREGFERNNKSVAKIAERFVIVQTGAIMAAQLINTLLLLQCQPSTSRLILLGFALPLFPIQWLLLRIVNDHAPIEREFERLQDSQQESGEPQPDNADQPRP